MRYVDMKMLAGSELTVTQAETAVTRTFASMAAALHVREAAPRSVQEISGLVTPIACLPTEMHTDDKRVYIILVREDVFDKAVLDELTSRNTLINQLQEVLAIAQHRAVVPDTNYGNDTSSGQEGSICSSGGGDADAKEDQLQGSSSK